MSREEIIEKTLSALKKLPEEKGEEVADFADFMLQKIEEKSLQSGIETIIEKSQTFSFLKDEEDLYSLEDLKEKY